MKAVAVEETERAVMEPWEDDEDEEQVVEALVTPPHARISTAILSDAERLPAAPLIQDIQALSAVHEPAKELSMIIEDEEMAEKSRISSTALRHDRAGHSAAKPSPPSAPSAEPSKSQSPPGVLPTAISAMEVDDFTQTTSSKSSESDFSDTFHTAPLDSSMVPIATPRGESQSALGASESSHASPNDATPGTVPPFIEPPSPKALARKPSIPHFPTIGAPSPLRKSMRVPREPSLAIAPTAGPSIPRSSWLVKAREAKAIEDKGKRTSALAPTPFLQPAPIAAKRKSGDMLNLAVDETSTEEMDRKHKISRTAEQPSVHVSAKSQDKLPFAPIRNSAKSMKPTSVPETVEEADMSEDESDGVIHRLKRTVEGYSARAGKSMGKSLGGAAATALAEARAAAEARIAERNAADGRPPAAVAPPASTVLPAAPVIADPAPSTKLAQAPVFVAAPVPVAVPGRPAGEAAVSKDDDRRLSVSDLVSSFESKRAKNEPPRVFQAPPPAGIKRDATTAKAGAHLGDVSTSTTPPNSPPRARQPIFTAQEKPKAEPSSAFFHPTSSHQMGYFQQPQPHDAPRVFSNMLHPAPFSTQPSFVSTQSSMFSDGIFDNETLPWVPSTQETDFSEPAGSQQRLHSKSIYDRNDTEHGTDMDADGDESWHLDDKFGEAWSPVVGMGAKDDSMTWSTAPTRSTRDTNILDGSLSGKIGRKLDVQSEPVVEEQAPARNVAVEQQTLEEEDMEIADDDVEEDLRFIHNASQSSVNLVPVSAQNSFEEWRFIDDPCCPSRSPAACIRGPTAKLRQLVLAS